MGWFPDEAGSAGQEHLDPSYVAGYDRKTGLDSGEEVDLLTRLAPDGGTLVDLGAGTGAVAIAAAPHFRRVVVVDVSGPMLEASRRRVAELQLENVELLQAGFLSYEHRGGAADVVYSRNALHHLPDFWKAVALERVSNMLRPQGILRLCDIVFDFPPGEAGRWIEQWLGGAASRPELGWTRAELETHVRDEYSTFSWLLEPMLRQAGFEIESVEHRRRVYADYVCRRGV
jgi:ubiquinone/menaquinone biosynthesis C-methylase UbiE